jgi:hypothetical protein
VTPTPASLHGAGAQVTPAISDLLGRLARSVEQFLTDNVDAFR